MAEIVFPKLCDARQPQPYYYLKKIPKQSFLVNLLTTLKCGAVVWKSLKIDNWHMAIDIESLTATKYC